MMRTTLDLPDSLLRELKSRAARNGQSLKSLLNELIQRALVLPAAPDVEQAGLPVLRRLQEQASTASAPPVQTNAQLAEKELEKDIEKLRRIGFVQ
jgi:plasmid stability protein